MIIEDSVVRTEEKVIFKLRELFSAHGFTSFKMNKFEDYDLYAGNKDFLISQGIITFTDTNGRLKALKPDVTLSIVKNSRYMPGECQKLYYDEKVYRVSNGSFREITQMGLEMLGDLDAEAVKQVLLLADQSLEAISSEHVLTVSCPGLLALILDGMEISSICRQKVLDAVSSKSIHEITAALEQDGVPNEKITALIKLLNTTGAPEMLQTVEPFLSGRELQMFEEMRICLKELPSGRCRIDFSIPCNLHYYNGIVFAGYVRGIPFPVLSGGEYEPLLKRMGKQGKGIGFAIYLDLLEEMRK